MPCTEAEKCVARVAAATTLLSMRLCRYRLPTHFQSFGDRFSGEREATRIAFEGL
jgi:hypothetical protein